MQDHLASLRSLIQDKEYIIENLMLRFDLGILQEDPTKTNNNLTSDEINHSELVRKAEALAQRTILENFELREMVNELRDENFHLRNEIYELVRKKSFNTFIFIFLFLIVIVPCNQCNLQRCDFAQFWRKTFFFCLFFVKVWRLFWYH